MNDDFSLYDLEISIVGDPATFVCSHTPGKNMLVKGENLFFDGTDHFSLYALSALLPLLPAKQRITHEHDWMSTDHFVACPDPNCGARFKISRVGQTTFHHSEVTKVPLEGEKENPNAP
jgi:uncharacterized repeat protein (TIGR04076 family)